ncbi:MAG: sensor histidine kinase [Actinomycetes bacterium]
MRKRLLLTIAATSTLTLLAFLVPLAVLVGSVAETRATSSAVLRVQALIPVISQTPTKVTELAVDQINNDGGPPVTVFLPNGGVLGAEASTTDAVRLAETGRTVVTDTPDGREIAIPIVGLPEGTAVIRVLVEPGQLENGVVRARIALLGLAVTLLLLAIAIGDTLARTFTRPLEATADTADRLAAGDLEARAKPSGPHETRSVAIGLNRLAGRILDLLRAEREAAADLSHRLRTPVTALRLDVEALPESPQRDRLVDDVTMLTTSIDAVIYEARHPSGSTGDAVCDATEVVAERLRFWSALADDEGRSVQIELPSTALKVATSDTDLAASVDAILGNVFAHTPPGTSVHIELRAEPGGARLSVIDSGPGWPEGWPDLDMERRGHSPAGSTGLGLDIVGRVATSSGGQVELLSPASGGAEVRVHLKTPASRVGR